MTINFTVNPIFKTNTQTGEEIKVEGGNLSLEMSAEEFTSVGTTLIKSLPAIKEGMTALLGFEVAENDKRRAHEVQMQNNEIAANQYKNSLEETNAKLREENRELREELFEATRNNSGAKVPTRKELK